MDVKYGLDGKRARLAGRRTGPRCPWRPERRNAKATDAADVSDARRSDRCAAAEQESFGSWVERGLRPSNMPTRRGVDPPNPFDPPHPRSVVLTCARSRSGAPPDLHLDPVDRPDQHRIRERPHEPGEGHVREYELERLRLAEDEPDQDRGDDPRELAGKVDDPASG